MSVSRFSLRKSLRKRLRAKRNALSSQQQKQAALGLLNNFKVHSHLLKYQHFALYWANDGEISTHLLLQYLQHRGKQCYFPVLRPRYDPRLWFVKPYNLNDRHLSRRNRFGILEAKINKLQKPVPLGQLDVVFVPLVGFDILGHRLGMGGGFYDRTFALLNTHAQPKSPLLIGLAHECQKITQVPKKPWDVPLASIITDRTTYYANS